MCNRVLSFWECESRWIVCIPRKSCAKGSEETEWSREQFEEVDDLSVVDFDQIEIEQSHRLFVFETMDNFWSLRMAQQEGYQRYVVTLLPMSSTDSLSHKN